MNNTKVRRAPIQSPAQNRGGFRPFTPPTTCKVLGVGNAGSNRPEPQRGVVENSASDVVASVHSRRHRIAEFLGPSSSGNYSRGGNTNYWNCTAGRFQ